MAREFLREFFALYKSLPCLWNKKDPKFRDKFQNDLAMMELTKMYRGLAPDATQAGVRKELQTFRACLQKDHKRRKEAQKAGLPVDSGLWYYNDLSFLLDSNASKPSAFQKANNLRQSKAVFKEKTLPPKSPFQNSQTPKCSCNGEETPARKRRIVSAGKQTKARDKYDLLAEKFRSLPDEQFGYVENILTNIFKFAEHENQEWINASTITSRQESTKSIATNIKTVQSKAVGNQGIREIQSNTIGTQASSVQTTLNSPPRSIYHQQLTRSSPTPSTITSRQEAPIPSSTNTQTVREIQSKTIAIQADLSQPDLSSPCSQNSPNIFRQCSASSQSSAVVHDHLQNLIGALRKQIRNENFQ